ncbi:hypothetical protein Drose_15835 [Dactylosporangium roseum]|uniref:Uncharacterized protein n=1 Tax=Dactylosporangium roseum TaxID=47989 RepID=A0ABY5ZC06_9ACTN|nr:S1 family peptidase [Dactylosporangium roseum]UWZ39566.1 hypothetical protein Drose_15835 [Dactylosporangium roseum]
MALKSWIITQPGVEDSGYVESVNDVANLATTVLWHGAATPFQQAIVAQARSRGIALTIKQRKFSRTQLLTAAQSAARSAGKGALTGFDVTSVATLDPDFDGVIVRGNYLGASSKTRAARDATLAKGASAQIGVDVSVAPSAGRITPAVATRSNDTAPFNAGGYMRSPSSGTVCTTGFGIWLNGVSRTTTARHCWRHDYRARDGSASYGDGLVNSGDGAARVMTTGGFYWMFDGAWNNSAGYKKTVIGYSDVSTGDLVCASGGNSGVRCAIEVRTMCVLFNDGMGFGNICTIQGHQQSNGIAAIQGDSGGPVFTLGGTNQVRATGMIQAVQGGWTNCAGVHDGGGNICSDWMLFSSMRTINNSLGASLRTG